MSPADLVLFERWRTQRDPEAFRHLAERYGALVYAVAKRITGNPQDAEDVAQAAFETLAVQGRAPRVHLGAWLHRVATYRALTCRRGERRRREREMRFAAHQARQTEIGWSDIYEYVDEAVAALPARQREAIVAYYFEGKTHSEIAAALGISRPAVTQQVQRGITGIRTALQRRGIAVPLAALGAQLANGAETAVPAAVLANASKIALSGFGGTAWGGIGLWQGGLFFLGNLKAWPFGLAALSIAALWGISVLITEGPPADPRAGAPTAPMASETDSGPPLPQATAPESPDPGVSQGEQPTRFVIGEAPATVSGTVYESGGAPYPGAIVHAAILPAAGPPLSRRVATDDDGQFSMENLPRGAITLVATPTVRHDLDPATHPHRTQLSVLPGGDYPGLRLVVDPDDDLTIDGRVLDQRGQPIAGATVFASELNTLYGFRDAATTDAAGRFTIPHLRAESLFDIHADAPGKSLATVTDIPSGATRVELVLPGQGSVEGMVVDAVTGAPLEAFTCEAVKLISNVNTAKSVGRTGDKPGWFRIDGVDVGESRIKVSAPGYLPVTRTVSPVVEGQVLTGIRIALDPERAVEGRVVDTAGNPVSGANINCAPEATHFFDPRKGQAISDGDGYFLVKCITEYAPVLAASHRNYSTTTVALDFPLTASVTLVLEPGGMIAGVVTASGATGAGRIFVSALEEGTGAVHRATPGANGAYSIRGVTPGLVELKFQQSTYPEKDHRSRSVSVRVEAGETTPVDMDFPPTTSLLEGLVLRDGAGVPRVTLVLAIDADGIEEEFRGETDDAGYYHFDSLPSGAASLTVIEHGQAVADVTLTVPPDSAVTQDIMLEAPQP